MSVRECVQLICTMSAIRDLVSCQTRRARHGGGYLGVIAPTDVAAKDTRPAYRTGVYGSGSRSIPADDDD